MLIVVHSQSLLPVNPGCVLFGFVHSNGFFASDCIKQVVKILAGDELIKIRYQLDPNHTESLKNGALLLRAL